MRNLLILSSALWIMAPTAYGSPEETNLRSEAVVETQQQSESQSEDALVISTELIVGDQTQANSAPYEELTAGRIFSVTVDGDRRDSRDEVYEEALYLAAKKTERNDFEWFRVVNKETDRETTKTRDRDSRAEARFERVPERRCGLLSCKTEYRTRYRGEFGAGFPEREDTLYSVTLDFEMGVGPATQGGRIYYSDEIKRDYRK